MNSEMLRKYEAAKRRRISTETQRNIEVNNNIVTFKNVLGMLHKNLIYTIIILRHALKIKNWDACHKNKSSVNKYT